MDAYNTGSVAMGKVIDDFILTEVPSKPPYTANVPSEDWQITLEQLKIYRGTLPADVLRHNFTLPAGKLGALFEHLVTAPDILSLIPLEPWKTGAYKILQSVMQLVRETLNPPSRKYRRFHAWLAFWWMRGESLRWLIDARFKNCKDAAAKNGEPLEMTINDVIPTIVDGIEKTLRFEYARDIKAYLELLPLALAERDPDAEHPPIPPLPLYLECGTTNQKVIKLMSLGLTRMTAMFAAKLITMIRTDATPEQWFSALAKLPLKNVKLPKVCIQEIEHLTRGR